MALFTTYVDCVDFLENSAANVELNSLIGGNATLTNSYAIGATSIVVTPFTGSPITNFSNGPAWILDGFTSEIVTITSVNTGTNTLTLASPGLAAAHLAGVNISTAGSGGCLAKSISDAARKVDTYCRQGPAGVSGITAGSGSTLSASASIGQTSLTVASSSSFGAGQARILDGFTSEVVQVQTVGTGTLTLLAPGCLYAHANGTPIVPATGDRTLYALPRVETYTLATMTAFIDPDQTLMVWPYHFPVQSIQSMTLQLGASPGFNIIGTGLVLPNDARQIMVPRVAWTASTSNGAYWWPNPALRDPNVWLTLQYAAGPIPLALSGTLQLALVPDDIKRATYLYTLFTLATRSNQLGAASVRQGDTNRQFELRGNAGKHSLLQQDADEILMPYRRG